MDDLKFLRKAYTLAYNASTDGSTQNGAIIVSDRGEMVAQGANHFPRDVKDIPARWVRPIKYKYVEHAERNAIYDAAKKGVSTHNLTMYAAWAACSDCARAIIQAGIKRVVTHHDPLALTRLGQKTSDMWIEEISHAITMLKESGVTLDYYEDKLFEDDFTILYNGQRVSP